MEMDIEAPFLPPEIIANILKRLPVKSLIRFRCVCKHWKDLFKTPSFITAHLQHSSDGNPFLLFKRYGTGNNHLGFHLLDCKMQVHEIQNVAVMDGVRAWIVGSCNGLICFRIPCSGTSPGSFLLWNPATREVGQVPTALTNIDDQSIIAFGFNPIVNDYKIVVNYTTEFNDEVNRVEVYSLSTGSWNQVEFGNLLDGISLRDNSLTLDGVTFWLAKKRVMQGEDGDDDTYLIVSFDIVMEEFTLISMPNQDFLFIPWLAKYDNKLAILFHTRTASAVSLIHLWVMEEDTGPSTGRRRWTKKYTSKPFPFLSFPNSVFIWRSQIFCNGFVRPGLTTEMKHEANNDKQITLQYVFDLITNEYKMFPDNRLFEFADIFNYNESLVPVHSSHIQEP